MYIGHTESTADILKEMGNYKNDADTYTFVKKLQTRYVAKDYFLLWSTDYIDTNALIAEINRRITLTSTTKYQFAFAWSPIKGADGKKYPSDRKDQFRRDDISALHIQVPEESKNETYNILSQFFGLDTKDHIFGRELLMVPILRKTNTALKNTNIERLIQKHAQFYAELEHAQCNYFLQLDKPCPPKNLTIRQMMMGLITLDGHGTKLFWSIDADGDKCTYLTFPSFLADEARNIIAQLPSLLHHLHGVEALSLMTDSAQRQAIAAPWDVELMCARSKDDKMLEAMVITTATTNDDDVDSDLDSNDDSIDTAILDGDPERETHEYLFNKASSNDSVNTLDTRLGNKYSSTIASNTTPNKPKNSKKNAKNKQVHATRESPSERQKYKNLTQEEIQHLNDEIERDLNDDFMGSEMESEPTQRDALAPGPHEGLGEPL